MATDDSDMNCELNESLASNHTELVTGLKDIQTGVRECKEGKDKAREVQEQRRLATETYQQKKTQGNLALAEKLREIMETRNASRRESMRAADGQRMIEEIQLHHAKVQNIIANALFTPQSDTRSLASSSFTQDSP